MKESDIEVLQITPPEDQDALISLLAKYGATITDPGRIVAILLSFDHYDHLFPYSGSGPRRPVLHFCGVPVFPAGGGPTGCELRVQPFSSKTF